jgi:hypothetical protein
MDLAGDDLVSELRKGSQFGLGGGLGRVSGLGYERGRTPEGKRRKAAGLHDTVCVVCVHVCICGCMYYFGDVCGEVEEKSCWAT